MGDAPFRVAAESPEVSSYELEPNPRVGSPLVNLLQPFMLMPLVTIPFILVGVVLGALLRIPAHFAVPGSALLGLAGAYVLITRMVKKNRVRLTVQPADIIFTARRQTLGFARSTLVLDVEAREWVSPRTSGHNTWTLITFRDRDRSLTVGTDVLFQTPSGKTGQPQFIVPPEVFRKLAAELSVALQGPTDSK